VPLGTVDGVIVQVVGLGLIGGSIAAACRRAGVRVRGVDADAAVTAHAAHLGLVDEVGTAVADVTFVATPAATVPGVVAALPPGGGVVSDVAGVKTPVVRRCDRPNFVGGHPFAGSERSGPDAAREDLFDGAAWALTPGPSSSPDAVEALVALVRRLGAEPLVMDPGDHDRLAAAVSHVPHVVAAALARAAGVLDGVDPRVRDVVAGGFGDVTRVASSPVGFWPQVLTQNRDEVLCALDALSGELDRFRAAVAAGDTDAVADLLEVARRDRGRVVDDEEVIGVEVLDAPGSVAAVLDALAAAGVDVADVDLVPHLQRRGAQVRLVVAAADADAASAALTEAGFAPSR
jgi:prephenate dehydrogenase